MMHAKKADAFGADVFALNHAAETKRICDWLVATVRQQTRRGLVVGVSGGIDSAVCAALAVRALGPERVFCLLMPERDMVDDAHDRGRRLCEQLGVAYAVEEIESALEGLGCYQRRDEAIARIVPGYGKGWKHKIVVSPATEGTITHFNIVVQNPAGEQSSQRMPVDVYLQVVAATNFKQRVRKNFEYYHGDRLNYAVIGTPNKLEYDLGFFVRGGDGLADVKPIAHFYKSQVYAMAEYLGVTAEIRAQTPSTNTYSLPQTQEEFYYALPYEKADLALYALLNGVDVSEAAGAIGVTEAQLAHVFKDFKGKQRAAERLLADAAVLR
ncbi:MAG: NAD(+) synthase [Hyphomonadaceae bacterium]|nr:NAD(+) synthase [Hyphomonadaceae bacterium]